ncbi:MAG: thioredoxin domain-containing protein, partial [Bacteroidota bacterium]
MKHLMLIAFFSLSFLTIQAQGIEFIHESWTEALEKANAEDKIIFVDAYTTWCGPCKWMAKNVFPEKEVGDLYNNTFVNLKLDMEKGEGLTFAKKYNVRAYPTLLFINKEGEVVHKALGGRPAAEFVTLGQQAADPNQQVYTLKKRYEAGEDDPAFLKNLSVALSTADMEGSGEVAEKYLASLSDWSSKDVISYIFQMAPPDVNHNLFKEIVKNRAAYNKVMGEETINDKFKWAAMQELRKSKANPYDLAAIKKVYMPLFPEKGQQYAEELQLMNYQRSKEKADQKVFLSKAVDYLKKYKVDDPYFLNSMAWTFYEKTDDVSYLKKACKWAKKSVKKDSQSFNNDTVD